MAPTTLAPHRDTPSQGIPAPPILVEGLSLFEGDLESAADRCIEAARSGHGARVATVNLDFLAIARSDPQLRADLQASTLLVADGMPVAWLARLAGQRNIARITGVDLVAAICRRGGAHEELRLALFGSEPDLAARASVAFEAMSPGVRTVFMESPPFRPWTGDEVAGYRDAIAAAAPHMVLVALGCPRQERLIAEWFESAPGAAWIGVGGTFDFFAGRRRRAPRWMQRTGTEWLARLAQDPRRLWRRYLLRDLPVMAGATIRCLRERRVSTTPGE